MIQPGNSQALGSKPIPSHEVGSPHWTIFASGGSGVRLCPAGFGESRHRGERGQELQSPLPQAQPADATRPQSDANAAVKAKGTIFAIVYRRLVRASATPKPSVRSPTGSIA